MRHSRIWVWCMYTHEREKQWDNARSFHSGNLDTILEALGTQPVPAAFYESPTSSSVFSSQFPDPDGEGKQLGSSSKDRSRWKTLRDFVDERAIEDASETVDNERTALDVRCDSSAPPN